MSKKRIAAAGVIAIAVVAAWFFWLSPSSTSHDTDETDVASRASAANEGRAVERKPSRWGTVVESTGALSLDGIVRNEAGEPVSGATVTATAKHGADVMSDLKCQCDNHCGFHLLECGCAEASGQLVELAAMRTGESVPLARATTGADGRFTLTRPSAEPMALWAETPTGIAFVDSVTASSSSGSLEVTLKPARFIKGTVTNLLSKAGVGGALVTAIYAQQSRFFDAVAMEDGSFRIGPLPSGKYALVASAAALLPEHQQFTTDSDVESEGGEVSLTLATPRTLGGVVTAAGTPVAGVEVKLEGQHRKRKVTTDAKGRFQFASLRPGDYELHAASRQGVGIAKANLPVTADNLAVAIDLDAAAVWHGVVVDEAGQPIEAATVSATPGRRDGAWVQAKTDERGQFELPALPPGSHLVHAQAHGFSEQESRSETLAESGGELKFTLIHALVISGTVVDQAGLTVIGATVTAAPSSDGGADHDRALYMGAPEGLSGDGGTFSLFVKPGQWGLHASKEGYMSASTETAAPAANVRLVLSEGAMINGTVFEADGGVAARVTVHVEPPEDASELTRSEERFLWTELYKATAITRADGHFSMKGLPPGKWELLARHSVGSTPSSAADVSVAALDARVFELQTTTVVIRFAPGRTVAGRVIDEQGQPLSGVNVYVSPKEEVNSSKRIPEGAQVISGENGEFAFGGLRSKLLQMTARDKEGRFAVVDAQAGDLGVIIKLPNGAYARGRLLGDDGAPLREFKVNSQPFTTEDGTFRVSTTDQDHLAFDAAGYAQHLVRLPNPSGGNDLGDIKMPRGTLLTGRVIDAITQQPLADAFVDVGSEATGRPVHSLELSESRGAVKTNSKGQFRLQVSPSADLLLVKREEYMPYIGALETGHDVTIALNRGLTLTVTVKNRDGQGVPTYVTATSAAAVSARAVAGPDGVAKVNPLSPGDWTIAVRPRTGVYKPVVVHVTGDQSTTVNEATTGSELKIDWRGPTNVGLTWGLAPGVASNPYDVSARWGVPGSTSFQFVEPGEVTVFAIRASPGGGPPEYFAQQVTVTAEAVQTVVINAKPWVRATAEMFR